MDYKQFRSINCAIAKVHQLSILKQRYQMRYKQGQKLAEAAGTRRSHGIVPV